MSRRRPLEPRVLVEERDSNQSHLRMSYRPAVDISDPRAARGADDLLDPARRLDGLAPVRRDPRAARSRLLGLRDRPRLRRRRRCCSSRPGSTRASASRPTTRMREIVTELRTEGPTESEIERARAYAAGARTIAFENTGAVARYAAQQKIVYGEDVDPDTHDRPARRGHLRAGDRDRGRDRGRALAGRRRAAHGDGVLVAPGVRRNRRPRHPPVHQPHLRRCRVGPAPASHVRSDRPRGGPRRGRGLRRRRRPDAQGRDPARRARDHDQRARDEHRRRAGRCRSPGDGAAGGHAPLDGPGRDRERRVCL